ncbi:MAG: hypothetical protein PWP20_1538, partial [Eubacteriaceae bacterium]|nr:hypothetical protein [Eubacteriaceae bacterium]
MSVYPYRKEWIKLEKSLVHRRESIIVSTIEVLNRVGLQNLSTKLAQKKLSPVASLRYFFSAYAEYYENYPEITVVMQLYDSLLNEAGLADKIRTIIHKRED